MIVRQRLIRARPNFYMINDIRNVSFENVDCSLYTSRNALKHNYHKKQMDMLAYTQMEYSYLKTVTEAFFIPAKQNQLIQKNFCNNARFHQIAIVLSTKYDFTESHSENLFRCWQLVLRQLRKIRGCRSFEEFAAANHRRFYFTTTKALNFQDEIISILKDNFKITMCWRWIRLQCKRLEEVVLHPVEDGGPRKLDITLFFE